MNYSKFGKNSDVFLYGTISGRIHCCNCSLKNLRNEFDNPTEALEHLQIHIDVGDKVPEETIEKLRKEIKN